MKQDRRAVTGTLARPQALLLDFGGVVVLSHAKPEWELSLARHVRSRLEAAGVRDTAPPVEAIAADIHSGAKADSHWKNAMSRLYAPRELRYEEFWGDFVAADWPVEVRAVVVDEARDLCRVMGHTRRSPELRDGMIDLLDAADAAGVPVGIVSNALCGQVHLDFLTEHGLLDRFAVEVHSDVAGIRKPNPEMILLAARKLGVAPADTWYVGDNFDRDVLCGRRAGVGGNILMEARKTFELPYELDVVPDAIVADPRALLRLFEAALENRAA